MYSNFDSHLGVEGDISREFITITDRDIDANFLIHHFISHFLQKKSNSKVCLLGFTQTQSHYTSACQKMGLNLQTAISKKQFVFVDMLRMLFDGFIADTTHANHLFSSTALTNTLKPLFELLLAIIKGDTPSLVVVDDLSVLVNIGIPVQVVADFLHYCKNMTVQRDVSFLFLSHADEDDAEFTLMNCWLKRYSTLELNVCSLQSGYSNELSGDMTITRHQCLSKLLHFKLMDKDVKFYAPGTSSVIL